MAAVTRLAKCVSHFSSLARRCFFSKVSSHASPREDLKNNHVRWVFLGCPGVDKGVYASRLSLISSASLTSTPTISFAKSSLPPVLFIPRLQWQHNLRCEQI
ncbi:putative adenylate kinase 1, chloroplastic [Sesbania bispinosa]|nr:putative adenylate kinase 1, chloroplastic [Sesbania bispinosa]